MYFKNPENGYIEERPLPWLGGLLFGGLYFIVVGLWAPLIVWVILLLGLYVAFGEAATLFAPVISIVYAVLAPGLVRRAYLRKGWTEVVDEGGAAVAETIVAPQEKKCPFCAETIKAEAIKCKHCGSDIPPPVTTKKTVDVS